MTVRALLPVAALTAAACALAPAAATAATKTPSTSASTFRILVSNDDGVKAPGIDRLVQALRKQPHVKVTVVAPATNQSGSGGKTTPGTRPARRTTTRSGFPAWAVTGYPADSIAYALGEVIKKADVDLVISGINQGANLGPFVDLSGTVGAARAAARAGLPALATSAGTTTTTDFTAGASRTIAWLKANRTKLKPGTVQNLNVPECAPGAVRGTVAVRSTPVLATGVNPFAIVDCTQTAAAGGDDVTAFLQGFATLTKVPAKPGS